MRTGWFDYRMNVDATMPDKELDIRFDSLISLLHKKDWRFGRTFCDTIPVLFVLQ